MSLKFLNISLDNTAVSFANIPVCTKIIQGLWTGAK